MIKKILKLLIPLIALFAGAAGGFALKPRTDTKQQGNSVAASNDQYAEDERDDLGLYDTPETHAANDAGISSDYNDHDEPNDHAAGGGAMAWFDFSRQFFVPLVRQGDESGVIILSISLETDSENLTNLNDQESRLRDIVLRQLLIAANTGRFDGNFTTEGRIRGLRKQILVALQNVVGRKVTAVLISDLVRQDE